MRKILLTIFSCALSFYVMAQERTVTGKVTSFEDGTSLPGVNVVLKGTTKGTTTDSDGNYTIQIPDGDNSLVFSFIGLETKEVAVGGQSKVDVILAMDITQLGEVVVQTSMGIARSKKDLGYGVAEVKAEQLTTAKVTNVTNALTAKIPGVQVNGSGGAFTGSSVIIRGFTTFTGSNQPLYVVDGIPIDNSGGGTPLQSGPSLSNRAIDINPEDVESMTVLKGAAATALYGSRGASGVILITTKKASKGAKNTVTYSSSFNIANVNRLPDYQNEYAQGSVVGGLATFQPGDVRSTAPTAVRGVGTGSASSWGPKIMGQDVTDFFGLPTKLQAYPDNVKDIFQTGHNWQNNLSFAGSSDKTTYRVAYGNATETYIIDNNKLGRNNLTANVSSQITPRLTVGTSFTYTNTTSRRTQQGNQLSNPLFRAYFTPRSYDLTHMPYQNELGQQLWYGLEDQPYWSIEHVTYKDDVNRIFGNVNARYELTDWLYADLKVGTDFYTLRSNGFDDVGIRGAGNTGASQSNGGGIIERENTTKNFNSYLTFTGTKKFDDFNLLFTLGNEINQNYTNTTSVTGYGIVIPGFDNLKNTVSYLPSYAYTKTRLGGIFADVEASYRNFLVLNVKARNDWSSTLTKANRSIFYPAAALSFVATEAISSLKENKSISLVKLRANIGEVGKGAGVYNTDSYYVSPAPSDGFTTGLRFPYNGITAFTLSNTAGNPNLKPEFTREVEFGVELGFFENRLTFDGSIYQRKTRDVILSAPFSAASGVTNVTVNAGKLTTNGVEFLVGIVPVRTSRVNWSISANFTHFKSMVDELATGVSVITLGGFTDPNVRLVAGQQYGQLYGYDYQRDEQGRMLVGADGLPRATANLTKIGNPNPKWTMGITNTVDYRGFALSLLVDIRHGGDQYSRNIADLRRNGVVKETAELARTEEDGVTATKPYLFEGVYMAGTPNAGQANTTYVRSDQYWGNSGLFVAGRGYIFDTSWVRLREASLTYTLPSSLLGNTPFGSVQVGVFGRNLLLHAPNYPHLDPEQNALGISNAQGLEFNSLPNTRTIGANLRVTF